MMINSIRNSTSAAEQTQSAATESPKVYETPFGDVLASEITGINMAAWVTESSSSAASAAGKDEAALRTTGMVKPTSIASTTASTGADSSSATTTGTTASTSSASTASAATSATSGISGNDVPTLESVFGTANVWLSDPTGSGDGVSWNYNPIYFATEQTAETVAKLLGGTVVASDDITSAESPLQQSQPNEMVQLSNGTQVNAGLVADLYNHGYPQSYINQELAEIEQQGVSAS